MQIQPCGPLRGEITVPGDKSISHRAVMLGALANGTTHITGFLMGEDCLSTIDCFRKMGVEINITDDEVIVEGVGLHGLEAPSEALYTGNSGTTVRHSGRSAVHRYHERRPVHPEAPDGPRDEAAA